LQGLLAFQQAYAATYYVSPSGSDANNGTSLTTPVKTIKNALSKAKVSGDIVYVMTGTYVETLNISQSGITLSAYPNNQPIIDGQNSLPSADWGSLISVTGNNNTVSGFEVKNSNVTGARVGGYGIEVSGSKNTLSNMNVHHTWETGIIVEGDYSTVQDSQIWQAALHNSTNNGSVTSGWANGLGAARNQSSTALKPGIASYPVLQRNTVYNNWGEGISCFQTDHCIMQDNVTYDNWTVNLYLTDSSNALVQRNLVYTSTSPAITFRKPDSRPGIVLGDEIANGSSIPYSANNTIINNFVYNCNFSAYGWSLTSNAGLKNALVANNTVVDGDFSGPATGYAHTNSQIRNNIFAGTANSASATSGVTFSNNNWGNTPSVAKSSTDIVGNPQITRTGSTAPGAMTSAYFKVSATSPVIRAAMPLSNVPQDFFSTARSSTTPSIGGHEFVASTTTTPPSTTTTTPPSTTTTTPPSTTTTTPPSTTTTTPPSTTTTTPPSTTTTTPPSTTTTTPPSTTTTTPPSTTTTTPPSTTTTTPPSTTTTTPPPSTTPITGIAYYVSPTGVDTNNGKSLSAPLKTIKIALSKAVTGDVIYVMTGVYQEVFSIKQNGITLSAYQGNSPVIDGGTSLPSTDWGALITIKGNNNTVSGFEVKNSNINGVRLGGYGIQVEGARNTVSRVNVHHTWQAAILVNGDYSTVQDSTVWQGSRAFANTTGTSSGWGSGLSAARNASTSAIKKGITSYAVFRRNTTYNNWGEGISCYEADHCTMEDNISYDNWVVNLFLSDATNSLMQRNIVYVSSNPAIPTRNNSRTGILLTDEVSTVSRSANNTLINNFIYNTNINAFSSTSVNGSGLNNVLIANNTIVDGALLTGQGGSSGIVNSNSQIRNNIITGSGSGIPGNSGITFSNNNWTVAPPAPAKSSTDIIANPQIARTGTTTAGTLTSDYFKVPVTSPVVNKGAALPSVTQDFFKTPRHASTPNIGGHEVR
jgi:hypothetical protein